ncbi:hypothetical protein [Crocosphaera sp. XPORK-15E]|uniref:hypothetical protein n=1 Tax=Crocosphaera sp. XPORK-15E TaxID=3110247 RepID=UPI002B20EBD5|nr:hypothetical protein [Crocosphaera sp. XPORK-15E]
MDFNSQANCNYSAIVISHQFDFGSATTLESLGLWNFSAYYLINSKRLKLVRQ